MKTKLFYNPRCSKCREAKTLLEQESCSFEIVEYLKDNPSEAEIKEILDLLQINALDLIRKGESLFKEKYAAKNQSNTQWIKVLAKNPILIERPILIHNGKAIIGRPPSLILKLITNS